MMKQSKNKKGRLAKSTLSVVLAASMVMTSSSFVWASPNNIEEINAEPVAISEYVEEIAGETQEATPTTWGTDLTANLPTDEGDASGSTFTWCVEGTDTPIKEGEGTEYQKLTAAELEKEYVGKTITCVAHITDADNTKDATTAFSIIGKTLKASDISVTKAGVPATYKYTGEIQNPQDLELKCESDAVTLAEGTYALEAFTTGNTNVGDGGIKIMPTETPVDNGAYIIPKAGIEITNAFTITATDAALELSTTNVYKVGDEAPAATDFEFKSSVESFAESDFDLDVRKAVMDKPGTFEVTATLKGTMANNYESKSASATITVVDKAADSATIAEIDSLTYNGLAQTPKPKVTISGHDLDEKTDFIYSYANNTDAWELPEGAALNDPIITSAPTVTITFKGAYKNRTAVSKNFEIKKVDLKNTDVNVDFDVDQTFVYNGKEQLPAVKGVSVNLISGTADTKLTKNDYTIKAKTEGGCVDANAGKDDKSVAVIEGKGNYKGTAKVDIPFKIEKKIFSGATVSVKGKSVKYTGGIVTPEFIVTDLESGKPLSSETDYKVEYANEKGTDYVSTPYGKDYGTYDVKITVKSTSKNYKAGSPIFSAYTIGAETLENATVTAMGYDTDKKDAEAERDSLTDIWGFVYDADSKGQAPNYITLEGYGTFYSDDYKGTKTNETSSFTAEFPDAASCVNAGTYDIKLTGKNDLSGQTATIKFAITPVEITAKDGDGLTVNKFYAATTHTGDAAKPFVDIVYNDYQLVEGTDFTAVVDAAAKKVTVTGIGNFKTEKPVEFAYSTSSKVNLNDPAIKVVVNKTFDYTGSALDLKEGDLTVTEVGTAITYPLVYGRDYKIDAKGYTDNTEVGTAYATIIGVDASGFIGSRKVAFEIVGKTVESAYKLDTTNFKTEVTYDGFDHKVLYSDGQLLVRKTSNNSVAPESEIKEIKYFRDGKETKDFKSTGTITMEITMKNYSGALTASYTIVGKPLTDDVTINDKIADQDYTGQEIKPAVEIKVKETSSSVIVKEGTDYEISYKNNIDVGEAYAIVKGIGRYSGSYMVPFNIVGTDISKAIVTTEGSYTYTGEAIIPTVIVKLGDTVIDPANYDIKATDNTNAGTATVTVTGKGNCTGTPAAATFVIAKADQKLAVSKTTTDALKVRNTNANTYTLKVTGAGTKLSYKSSDTKIAAVNAAGKISFKHVCGKATIIVTAAADDNHNAATLKVAVAVKPATPKITIAARAKGFNAKATAVKDITGYQVGYSTDKNFAAAKTTKKLVKTTKALNKNFSGLAAKKGYYVRVRAYRKVGSTVYWGNWTSAKKITTK